MANYGNFNFNKKKKKKKIWGIAVGGVAVIIVVLFYIGLTAGSDAENAQSISSAVAENTKLKEEIYDLNNQLAEMQETIDNLNEELEARPTLEPTPYNAPSNVVPTQIPVETISPRTGRR